MASVAVEEAGITFDLINMPEYQKQKYEQISDNIARQYKSLDRASALISSCNGVAFPKLLQALKDEHKKLLADIDESVKLSDEYLAAHFDAIESGYIKERMVEIYINHFTHPTDQDLADPRKSYLEKQSTYHYN